MNQTVNTLFEFYEDTKVGEVAHLSSVFAVYRIFGFDSFPWVILELLDTERHLALLTVKRQDNGLNLIAYVQELLSRTEMLAPRHF